MGSSLLGVEARAWENRLAAAVTTDLIANGYDSLAMLDFDEESLLAIELPGEPKRMPKGHAAKLAKEARRLQDYLDERIGMIKRAQGGKQRHRTQTAHGRVCR